MKWFKYSFHFNLIMIPMWFLMGILLLGRTARRNWAALNGFDCYLKYFFSVQPKPGSHLYGRCRSDRRVSQSISHMTDRQQLISCFWIPWWKVEETEKKIPFTLSREPSNASAKRELRVRVRERLLFHPVCFPLISTNRWPSIPLSSSASSCCHRHLISAPF